MADVYIRINPRCKRETSVVMGRSFEKRRGWYGPVDDSDPSTQHLLAKLETISDNDSNPHAGQPVFELKGRSQAVAVEVAETKKADPRGTVENPNPVPADKGEPARRSHSADELDEEPAKPRRRRGGSK